VLLGGVLTLAEIARVAVRATTFAHAHAVSVTLFLFVGFLSVTLAARTAWSYHRERRVFIAWVLVATSLLAFWLGEVLWTIQDFLQEGGATSPAWADIGYLAYYPLLVAALFLLPVRSGRRQDSLRVVLDMTAIVLFGGLLAWFFVLEPALSSQGAMLGRAIAVAYPACDLLLILGVSSLAVRPNRFRSRTALYSLLAAILVGFVADIAYGYAETQGTFQSTGVVDTAYLVSWFLFGLAAALESSARSSTGGATPSASRSSTGTESQPYVLPFLAIAFAVAVLLWALIDVFDARGGALAVVAVLLTILAMVRNAVVVRETSRLREQRALAASEEYYRGVLRRTQFSVDHATDVIMWLREDGSIVEVNESACRQLQYSRDELLSMTVFDLDPSFANNPESWKVAWERTRREGSTLLESTRRTKSGGVYPIEIRADYLEFDGQGLNCAFVRDVTERKQAEKALRDAEAQLRQAQKLEAIGQLAGGMAHDFNNLLAVISGYSELVLLSEPADGTEVRAALEEIRTAADRGAALTHQILLFSRRAPWKPQTVEMNDMVGQVGALLRRTLGDHIEMVTTLDPEAGWIKVDVNDFQQAVANLAMNARDAMPTGGTLTVSTTRVLLEEDFCAMHREMKPGPHVVLKVSDTGTGMDEETVNRAFEPFFTTKGVGKGTGLGLAAVYGTVRQSKGTVLLSSEPGAGTTFTIYLPEVAPETAPEW
jgi:PAS domain S-box-containing protein